MISDTPNFQLQGIVLGFDFGLRRIGVAVGQTTTGQARPETTLLANAGEPQWEQIKRIIATWKPCALVVGLPLNMDGTEQPLTLRARAFANALSEHFQLPVYGTDERLTTVEARSRLFEAGGYRALKKIDAWAAQILLEEWLQQQKVRSRDDNPPNE